MGGTVFPSCSLAWGQTMVGVMVNSSKRTYASTPQGSQDCYIQCPWPHSRPLSTLPLLETPGHSQASPAHSLMWSLLLSPGSWCTQGFVCALQECFSSPVEIRYQIPLAFEVKFPGGSQSLCQIPRLGNLLWALDLLQQWENVFDIIVSSLWIICSMALWWSWWQPLPRGFMPRAVAPRSAAARACVPAAVYLCRRHSNTQRPVSK